MPTRENLFPITGTLRTWTEPLSVTPRTLFSFLSQTLVMLKKNQWETVSSKTLDDLVPLELKDDPGLMAFALIWRSLIRAMFEMTREFILWLDWLDPQESAAVVDRLDFSFEEKEWTIDDSLFRAPEDLPLITWIKEPFQQWLVGMGMAEARSQSAVERLSPYFASALFQEWLGRIQEYRLVAQVMGPPFDSDDPMTWAWRAFQARLVKEAHAPFFGQETFDNSQVYIPLRGIRYRSRMEDQRFQELSEFLSDRESGQELEVVEVEEAMVQWVVQGDPESHLRLVASSPGTGEARLTLMLAARLIKEKIIKVLRVPLADFDHSGGLVRGLDRFAVQSGLFPFNPIEATKEPLLFIFEKIGELPSNGRDRIENAFRFISQTRKLLEECNRSERRLLVLITGWEPMIKAARSVFPPKTEVFFLLQYKIFKEDLPVGIVPNELINIDQRDLWWQLYGRVTGKDYPGLPDELRGLGHNFERMTAHPTMIYPIAGNYDHDQFNFSEKTTISDIVAYRIQMSYEGIYNSLKPYRWLYYIEPAHFLYILEEIAILAWHGLGHTVKIKRIKERCDRLGLASQFDKLLELIDAGILRFLRYVRDDTGKEALSFQQRGLRNYLVSKRIVNEVALYCEEVWKKIGVPYQGLDETEALRRWTSLCGQAPIYPGLFLLIQSQIRSEDRQNVIGYQKVICHLIEWTLRNGCPMDGFLRKLEFNQAGDYVRNAEEALLAVHYACAIVTETKVDLPWPLRTSAGQWLRRLFGQRSDDLSHLALQCLGYLNLTDCIMDGLDLFGAQLTHSSFEKASLKFACLASADLRNSNLNDANLGNANLAKANLWRAYVRRANLNRVNLRQANLREADLSGSDLREANLRGADLRWTDLRRATLHGADLRGADVRWAYLEGTDLRGADLRGADLREVDMSRADVTGADFTWSDIDHASPMSCDLPQEPNPD